MAELVKAKVGSAWELDSELDFEVLGQDVDEGGVRTYRIDSREIREEALAGVFDRIEDSLSDFMTHRVSREHVTDIAKHGFILTGDCASLPGLDRRLAAAMGIPVHVAEDPANATIRGVATVLEELDFLEKHKRENQT